MGNLTTPYPGGGRGVVVVGLAMGTLVGAGSEIFGFPSLLSLSSGAVSSSLSPSSSSPPDIGFVFRMYHSKYALLDMDFGFSDYCAAFHTGSATEVIPDRLGSSSGW